MKRMIAIILIIAALALSPACGLFPKPPEPTAEPSPSPTAEPTASPVPTPEPTPAPTPEPLPEGVPEGIGDYARECVFTARDIMDELIDFVKSSPLPCDSATYPFVPTDKRAELSPDAAELYDAMLEAAASFTDIELACSEEEMDAALTALLFDHPEIETYFTMEQSGGAYRSAYFEPEARYYEPLESADDDKMALVKEQFEAFDTVSRYVASRVPEDFSALDKYRLLALYISRVSQYAHVHGEIPRYATCAYGAVINGYSICQGYAIGYEYLCRLANLDCRRVRNKYNDDNMHFWDIVTLDNGTYYVDVTWCDGSVSSYRDRYWLYWFMFTADGYHVANDGTTTTGESLMLYP